VRRYGMWRRNPNPDPHPHPTPTSTPQHIDGINLFGLISIVSLLYCAPAAVLAEGHAWGAAWDVAAAKLGQGALVQLLAVGGIFYHLYNQVGGAGGGLGPGGAVGPSRQGWDLRARAAPRHYVTGHSAPCAAPRFPAPPRAPRSPPHTSCPRPQASYMVLDQGISPVTFSVGNTMKRVAVVVSSVMFFRWAAGRGRV
jgi:hypothetical protein